MRIRGLDEETEEALDDYDELKGKIADLTKTEKTPGGISLFTDATKTEYKSTYQFLKDISEIYSDISDKDQAQLLETIGGKRGAQSLASILSNFDEVERAMAEMEDAAGSADAEMEIIQDSIEYKLNALKQTWVGTLQTLVDRGDFGNIIDGLTKVSEGISFVTSNLGLLKTAIIGIGTVAGTKGLGLFGWDENANGFKNKIQIANTGLASLFKNENAGLLNKGDNKAFLEDLSKTFGIADNKYIDTLAANYENVDKSVIQFAKDQKALNVDGKTLITTFEQQGTTLSKLSGIGKTAGNVLAKTFASIGNAIVSAGIALLVSEITSAIIGFAKSDELLAQRTQEIAAKYRDQKDSLTDYSSKLIELRTTMEDSTSTTEEVKTATSDLYDIQNELISQYGGYHDGIDLVNGDLETQLELLRGINQENARKALSDINSELSNKSKAVNAFFNLGQQGTRFLSNYFGDNKGFLKSLEDAYFGGEWGDVVVGTSEEQITEMINNYDAKIKTSNDAVKELLRSYSDVFKENSDGVFQAIGDIYEVNEAVTKLQQNMESLGMTEDATYKRLGEIYKDTNDKITQYGESYKTITEANILQNEELTKQYDTLSTTYNKYLKAQEAGNQEDVQKYTDEYVEAIAAIQDSNIEEQYKDYFMSMYPAMQQAVNSWELETKIKASLDPNTALNNELQKLTNWGLEDYSDQIKNGTLHQFGNIDMDKRVILEWSQELKDYYYTQLASWDYEPEVGSIDTVFGGSDQFDGHEIAFSPILQTEDGKAVFLSKDNLYEYINKVMEEAGKDGEITPEEILAIDAEGVGLSVGEDYIRGVIAGVDNYSGIAAEKIAGLMHFSGEYGAYNLAKQQSSGYETLSSDLMRNSAEEIKTRYQYYKELQEQGKEGFISQSVIEEFQALENAAANAGMTVDNFVDSCKAIPEYSDGMQTLKDLMGENFDEEFAETLSAEQLEVLVNLKPKEDGLKYTKEEIEDYLNPIEVTIEPKTSNADTAKELDSMKTAFDDLSTAYMSSVKNEDSSGNATNNIASAADIQGVNDAFGGVTEITADTELADINALSNALEVYDTALIENKGDAAAAQKAADQLATAYVDLSDVLDDLTEENKDYYIEQLKASGIENAEKVVNTRLSKQYQKTREALENLSKSVAQNRKYLDAGVDAGQDYEDAIANIQSDVQALLAVYDDAGNKIDNLSPEIDTQFIKDNLADIEAATEGDIDALDRLRLAVARINAAKAYIDIDLPADVVSAQLDNLMDKVAQVDAMDIEVGASVDDTAFIGSLQNMINSGQTTADAVSAAFESMGYNVEFTHKTATVELVKYVEEHGANGMPSYVPQKMKEQLSVPELKITRASKSSGAKVSNYNGGSSSKSGSSGGNGSDSGSSDSSGETFDWIEIKIERLEEKLSDLEKTANDVYDTWSTRNSAIADEIDTLTNEIQLQSDAAQGYLDKANSIDLSEDYKKKVREGEIKVETIKNNQDLVDNINDYTEWWNKYKDAENTVRELSITRSEYQQTLFDNIASKYEDAITNIEKTVDILNEQITRTEEFGFFVDEQYYNSLLDQEKQNYSKLESERNELINKLNEGLEKGYIKPYSEAWNDMYQSIMDVNIAMEESATNTRKLNNEIRQLKWDKFDWIEERMSDFTTEADFLIKLLQGENNYEDDGNFNNRGFAQAALVGAKYNDTLAKMERYKKAIAGIDKEMSEDPTKAADKEMIARKQALVDEYRNSIEAAEDEKQAMQSLVQEGINKHLEALQELINKYKESLDAEKDLYDWQKNVADQTKNIAELQKQLAAYEGDTSEEARKKRQELQSQLNSAQQSLEESQWDRYISETGELLDNMYGDYEDYLNGKLEEVKVLMDSMIGYINDNTTAVKNGIDEVKKEYGLTTQNFEGFAEGQTKLLNEWQDGKFVGDIAAVRTSLSNFYNTYVKISEKNTKDIIDTIGKVVVTDSEKGKVGVQEPKPANGNGTTSGGDPNKPGGTDTGKGFKDQTIEKMGYWKQNDDTSWSYFNPDGTWMHDTWFQDPDDGYWYYFDPTGRMLTNQFVGDNENEGYWLGDDGRMLPDKFTWQEDDTGWWFGDGNGNFIHDDEVWINGKQYRFNSKGYWYAKGTKGVPFNQLAYTQEDGQELVYRTDSGALLTPLGQGDMVFTNAMTQRLWEIASGTTPFSSANLSAPDVSSNLTQNVSAENTFNFNLPNVTNADEFIDELKNNERFEKIVQEVSIGRLMGNNKLNKYKY